MSKQTDPNNIAANFLSGEVFLEDVDEGVFGNTSDEEVGDAKLTDDDDDNVFDKGPIGTEPKGDDPKDDEDEDEDEDDDANVNGEDQKEPTDKEEPKVEDDPNGSIAYVMAKKWQEEGRIPKNVEIKADIDEFELERLYLQNVDSEALKIFKTEISERLKARNLNPEEFFNNDDLYQQRKLQQEYADLAKITYDELVEKSEDATEALKLLGMEYHYSRNANLEEDEAKALVIQDINSTDEEKLLKRYTAQFASHAQTLNTQIAAAEKGLKQKQAARAESDAAQIQKLLESGKIGGRQFSPEEVKRMNDGLRKEDQIYDGPQGKKRVSLYEKKRMEAEDSLEKQLEIAAFLILGINEEDIKDKSKRVGGQTMLEKLANASGVNKKNIATKKEQKEQEGIKAFFLTEN